MDAGVGELAAVFKGGELDLSAVLVVSEIAPQILECAFRPHLETVDALVLVQALVELVGPVDDDEPPASKAP